MRLKKFYRHENGEDGFNILCDGRDMEGNTTPGNQSLTWSTHRTWFAISMQDFQTFLLPQRFATSVSMKLDFTTQTKIDMVTTSSLHNLTMKAKIGFFHFQGKKSTRSSKHVIH